MQEQVIANHFIKRLLWQFCAHLHDIFHLEVFFLNQSCGILSKATSIHRHVTMLLR